MSTSQASPLRQRLPVPSFANDGHNGVVHWYCCDENLSWCLLDLTDEPECPDDCGCQPCVVCEDMEAEPCPYGCGERGDDSQGSPT